LALEFFTLTAQFAFGHGCDHSSYVSEKFHHKDEAGKTNRFLSAFGDSNGNNSVANSHTFQLAARGGSVSVTPSTCCCSGFAVRAGLEAEFWKPGGGSIWSAGGRPGEQEIDAPTGDI
jgi:hypothetical protein